MFSLMSKKKGKTIIIKILLKKSEAGDLSKVVSEQEKKKKRDNEQIIPIKQVEHGGWLPKH